MEVKTKTIKYYVTSDGKEFTNEKDALRYEERLNYEKTRMKDYANVMDIYNEYLKLAKEYEKKYKRSVNDKDDGLVNDIVSTINKFLEELENSNNA